MVLWSCGVWSKTNLKVTTIPLVLTAEAMSAPSDSKALKANARLLSRYSPMFSMTQLKLY